MLSSSLDCNELAAIVFRLPSLQPILNPNFVISNFLTADVNSSHALLALLSCGTTTRNTLDNFDVILVIG